VNCSDDTSMIRSEVWIFSGHWVNAAGLISGMKLEISMKAAAE
jgi:hypothetical protein